MRVIKGNKIIEDEWQWIQHIEAGQSLPDGDLIIPYSYWKQHRQSLTGRLGEIAVCINGDDDADEVAENLQHFKLLAVEFPTFRDGRGYSQARILRDHYAYDGDIRALGDVLRDQLFYLQRCGFSSFCLREDSNLEDAIKGLSDFSVRYQTAADGAIPVYKEREGAVAP